MTRDLVELDGLYQWYARKRFLPFQKREYVQAVTDVSFGIRRGEVFGLVGESGCGKSTIGHTILRLLAPTKGTIRFDGIDISHLGKREMRRYRQRMQLVFQDPYASLNPKMSIRQMLSEPLAVYGLARTTAERNERVHALLEMVGMPASYAERYPHEFSGGQRQRFCIARAISVEPEFIVADEPVSALDVSIQAQVIALLEDLKERLSLTLLLVAHDLGVVQYMSDRVGVLYLGRLVEMGTTRDLFRHPRHPYTQLLLASAPSIDTRHKRYRSDFRGEIPSPISPPSGCVFRTRCRFATKECAERVPPFTEVSAGHFAACIHQDSIG